VVVGRRQISFDAVDPVEEDETKEKKKFLKSARSERLALRQLLDQIALAHHKRSFEEWDEKHPFLNYPQGKNNGFPGRSLARASQKCYGETYLLQGLWALRWTVNDIP
jgi:DNA mismatch repair ATPase MutL